MLGQERLADMLKDKKLDARQVQVRFSSCPPSAVVEVVEVVMAFSSSSSSGSSSSVCACVMISSTARTCSSILYHGQVEHVLHGQGHIGLRAIRAMPAVQALMVYRQSNSVLLTLVKLLSDLCRILCTHVYFVPK